MNWIATGLAEKKWKGLDFSSTHAKKKARANQPISTPSRYHCLRFSLTFFTRFTISLSSSLTMMKCVNGVMYVLPWWTNHHHSHRHHHNIKSHILTIFMVSTSSADHLMHHSRHRPAAALSLFSSRWFSRVVTSIIPTGHYLYCRCFPTTTTLRLHGTQAFIY